MCLAVPMKITEVRPDRTGVAELDGSRHDVNLSLVPGAGVGTYVIVHAGFAIEKMNENEANTILALFDELAAMQEEVSPREVH
jgi:hydrogenase expression/formation protein HypC